MGASMADNIIINTVAPLLFTYGSYHDENRYKDKAIQCLEEIPAEKNLITKGFKELNIENKNARDSQALIELKNEYCNKKRCLECSIGNAVLKISSSCIQELQVNSDDPQVDAINGYKMLILFRQ